jgi:hypothetical protein
LPNYTKVIKKAARRYGINPAILEAQLRQESGLNPNAKSPAGAQGIAQFMPATAASYGVNLNDGKASDDIDGAARYMRDNLKRTQGDYKAALSIYNSGRPDAYKDPRFAGGQTYNYVKGILAAAGSSGQGTVPAAASTPARRDTTSITPGVDNSQLRQQLKLSYLDNRHNPDALLQLAAGLHQAQDVAPITTQQSQKMNPPQGSRVSGGFNPKQITGTAEFDGKKVAGWIAPILEYARQQGWKGTVNSGFRSDAEQQRIYDSGVRPAAVPKAYGGGGSNHEGKVYPLGAIDASDAARLAAIIKRSPYAKYLKWAGGKDPVHFSHPHNGSY